MNSRENLPMMLPANEIQAIGLDCMGDICVLGSLVNVSWSRFVGLF